MLNKEIDKSEVAMATLHKLALEGNLDALIVLTTDALINKPPIRAVERSLFPTMETVEEVVAYGMSQLPITTPNQLMSLMMTLKNTILKNSKD